MRKTGSVGCNFYAVHTGAHDGTTDGFTNTVESTLLVRQDKLRQSEG